MNFSKKKLVRRLGKRKIALFLIDSACLVLVYLVNFLVALQSTQSGEFESYYYLWNGLVTWCLIMVCRMLLSVYNNVWRYANVRAYLRMIMADFLGGCLMLAGTYMMYNPPLNIDFVYIGVWQSITVITFFNLMTLSLRLVYQQIHQSKQMDSTAKQNKIRVAIVGAGQVGASLADELQYNKVAYYAPVCFVDRDPEKIGSRVSGLPVYAEDNAIFDRLNQLQIQEIFIALPKLTAEEARLKRDFYMKSGCKIKLYDMSYSGENSDDTEEHAPMMNGGEAKRVIREIQIEDLLARDTKVILNKESRAYYRNQVVLVTGGGGSIGSELCRQVARCRPRKLIIVDIYENNAYDIQQELIRTYGLSLDLSVEIASVRDAVRLECIFANYHPDIVFHAAAHKHVPLMEHSACEAIKNNVMGTYNTANMAEKYGVKKFILISTDKAVNPTNVMGASKRLCEMVIQCRTDSATSFSAVRFGNVLGSNGSVIPLFRKQMEKGGPLTVTHRDVVRYFMTIPEASQLVMQAGAMAKSGELFVLDMGKPVRILSLAENMIRLAGMEPYKDIQIVEIGLRPGEKLYEELLIKTENLTKTDTELIFVEKDAPLTREQMEENLSLLREVLNNTKDELTSPEIRATMKRIVPTFKDPDEVNKKAKYTDEMKSTEAVDSSRVIVGTH